MREIPILLYHGITADASDMTAPFAVTPDDFARHMDLVVEHGFRCLTVSQFIDEMQEPGNSAGSDQDKIALVTFDDGYADFASEALPVLNERKIPSTMYLTSGWLEGGTTEKHTRPADKFLDWSQVPGLLDSDVEIGAHSHTHPHMDTLDVPAVIYELTRSKALIEDAIAQNIRSFAYPHGYSSATVRRLTAESGYDSAVGVRNMFSHRTDDVFRLARLMLMSDTTPNDVDSWLKGQGAPVATEKEGLKTTGWRTYRRAKAIITRTPGTEYA